MSEGFRAKWFIPCPANRCHIIKNGREVKSRMQLTIRRADGMLIDDPYYRCERAGCEHEREPIPAVNIDRWWVSDANKKRFYKSDEARMPEEMEVML